MAVGILRVQKVKAAQVGGMQYHNDRERGPHSNPDIDATRSDQNFELLGHGRYQDEIRARIDAMRKSTRAVRKDAVTLVEGVVTASPEFFEGKSAEEVRAFFETSCEFCKREFGAGNMIHFTVHMDETTPHAHFGFVPLSDGSLSWKKFFPSKWAMSALQDRFFEQVTGPLGMERGEKRVGSREVVRHRSIEDMKAENRRELHELEACVSDARGQLDQLTGELGQVSQRLERLRGEEERLAAEVAGLEPAAETVLESARYLREHRGDGEREAALAAEVGELAGRVEGLKREVGARREAVARAEGRVRELERERDGLGRRLQAAQSLGERLKASVRALIRMWRESGARKALRPLEGYVRNERLRQTEIEEVHAHGFVHGAVRVR